MISDLEMEGYITRRKSGRRNLYELDPALPLRHHTKQDVMVEDLLHVLSSRGTEELNTQADTR
tara:strand:- start:119 stop:307 length:189 start_codon:yes stop_codon:yes gene_type:complete